MNLTKWLEFIRWCENKGIDCDEPGSLKKAIEEYQKEKENEA